MKVLKGDGVKDTYTLDLPVELRKRCIHLMFHIGLLCRYEKNDDEVFPKWEAQAFYDVRQTDEEECFVDKIVTH
jgi:hypothetical protein